MTPDLQADIALQLIINKGRQFTKNTEASPCFMSVGRCCRTFSSLEGGLFGHGGFSLRYSSYA
ncbi:MAG: hypothetical protein OEW25_03140 [Nitrospira sp.]|nr:hypothetical protein [Nitrospira sp.]